MTLPVITYTLSITSNSQTMPSVSGTNRKWYSAVAANCSRDRSTSCSVATTVSPELAQAERLGRVARIHRNDLAAHEPNPQQRQQQDLDDHRHGDRAREPG